MPRWSILGALILAVGCGGSSTASSETGQSGSQPSDPGVIFPAPQLAVVEAEVIGLPGTEVSGLDAWYITTEMGWIGPDGDVVFEAVIKWQRTLELGCGILRRSPDGNVNTILMLGQPLPGTGGGTVRHPRLPLEARGDTLVLTALINDGDFEQGLFAVPKAGGTPQLLAGLDAGEFLGAVITDDGSVVAQVVENKVHSVLVVPPGGDPTPLCTDCEAGFSTDGSRVVVLQGSTVWSFELDGSGTPLVALGDPAPATGGTVTAIRAAWVTKAGDVVVHLETDDATCEEALVRLGDDAEVIAACGAPAPGTTGSFGALLPAAGRSDEVFFGARIDGDVRHATGIFCARPGTPTELLVANGDLAPVPPGQLALSLPDVVGGDGRAAFLADVHENGIAIAEGLFIHQSGGVDCLLTTGAAVAEVADATILRFVLPVRDAVFVGGDEGTLVHVGIREDRRPEATLGALLLFR